MGINFKGIIKGTLFATALTFIIIFILSLLSYFTSIGEGAVTICVYGAVIVGILLGTIIIAKTSEHKAFLHVMLMCLLYALLLIGISWLINGRVTFNSHFFAIIGGIFGAGLLGLIIGK